MKITNIHIKVTNLYMHTQPFTQILSSYPCMRIFQTFTWLKVISSLLSIFLINLQYSQCTPAVTAMLTVVILISRFNNCRNSDSERSIYCCFCMFFFCFLSSIALQIRNQKLILNSNICMAFLNDHLRRYVMKLILYTCFYLFFQLTEFRCTFFFCIYSPSCTFKKYITTKPNIIFNNFWFPCHRCVTLSQN